MFLRNYWYVAAWNDEVTREPLARTVLNEDIVLFRKLDGSAVALENRCAHRRLPLSAGRLVGDTIRCGYHGLEYDCVGNCIKIPGQPRPESIAVKCYPVVERDRFVMVWMGHSGEADAKRIISFPRLSDPKWGVIKVRLHVRGNYLLTTCSTCRTSRMCTIRPSEMRPSRRTPRCTSRVEARRFALPGT